MPRTARPVALAISMLVGCTTWAPPKREAPPEESPVEMAPGPTVVEYGPSGDVETLSPTLKVRFDRDMVVAWPMGMQPAGSVFEVTPPIEGRARWYGTDLVSLVAQNRLPLATTFSVSFALPDAMNGPSRAHPLRWQFSTPRPSCVLLEGPAPDTALSGRQPLLIECSAPLRRAGLREGTWLEVDGRVRTAEVDLLSQWAGQAGTLGEWAQRLAGPRAQSVIVVQPQTDWPWARRVEVVLAPGLRVLEGPLPTQWAIRLVAQDIPTFRVVAFQCEESSRELSVQFSTPVRPDQLGRTALNPPLSGQTFVPGPWQEHTTYELGRGDGGTTYQLTLPAGLRDAYGQSLGATELKATCPKRPTLRLVGESGVLRASQPRVIELQSADLDRARVHAIALSAQQLWDRLPALAFRSEWAGEPFASELQELGDALPPELRQRDFDLPHMSQAASTAIDLDRFLDSEDRALWLDVQGEGARAQAFYQVSDLALAAWTSAGPGLLQTVRLSDGAPLAGVEIRATEHDGHSVGLGRTDGNGLLRLAQPTDARLIAARTADWRSVAALVTSGIDEREAADEQTPTDTGLDAGEELVGSLLTERDLYAAGDTVYFVGWAAIAAPQARNGMCALPAQARAKVTISTGGKPVAETTLTISPHGKFWGSLNLPPKASPTDHRLYAEVLLPSHEDPIPLAGAGLRVASFNPSEIAVDLNLDQRHILTGETLTGEVRAVHRSGGGAYLSRAEATLKCHETGDASAWDWRRQRPTQDVDLKLTEGSLGQGRFRFQATPVLKHAKPLDCQLALHAYDRAGRVETVEAPVRIHPSRFYLKPRVTQAEPGQPVRVTVLGVGWHEEPVALTDVRVLVRRSQDDRVIHEQVVSTKTKPFAIEWPAIAPGDYTLEVISGDAKVHAVEGFAIAEQECPDEPTLTISAPDQVEAGDELPVEIHAPPEVRTGVLVLIRNGVQLSRILHFAHGEARVQLPIEEKWYPRVRLAAHVVHRDGEKTPALLQEERDVTVTSTARTLKVALNAPERVHPGTAVDVVATVRNERGQIAKGARVSLWAVDEGVLAVTRYDATAGLEPLSTPETQETNFAHTLSQIREPYRPDEQREGTRCARAPDVIPGCANVRGATESQPRTRFATTPLFAGDVAVDAHGEAHIAFALPHNLTAFRITAIATAPLPGGLAPVAVGTAQRRIESSLPLMIKPVVPSRVRPGDQVEATALVHNLSGRDGQVELSVQSAGDVLQFTGEHTRRIALRAGEERLTSVGLRAGQVGHARVRWQAQLRTDDGKVHEDAVELPIEVRADEPVPVVTAVSGRVPAGQSVPVRLPVPTAVFPDQTRISLRLSGSVLGDVEEALRELASYPYDCIEQTVSRLIPLTVAPVAAERLSGPAAKQLPSILDRLDDFDLPREAGVGFWPKAKPDVFATAWTTLVLTQAARAGISVDAPAAQARAGLLTLMAYDDEEVAEDVAALGLFALAEAGAPMPEVWQRRLAKPKSAWAQAMTAMAMARADVSDSRISPLLTALSLGLDETTTTARVRSDGIDGLPARSPVVAQAAVLWALARLQPQHPAIEKLTTSLLALRQGPAWRSTFENALALLALAARDGLREGPAVGQTSVQLDDTTLVPWTPLPSRALLHSWPLAEHLKAQHPTVALTVHAGSDAPVSYTAQLSYVPLDSQAAARAGMGVITTLRSRYGVQGTSEPLTMGEVFAIDVALWSEHPQEHVAVEIPLAAGLEPFDPSLGKRSLMLAPNLAPVHQLDVAAQEYHADRIRLFLRHLPAGPFRAQSVYVRAATPGAYLMPGAQAHAMYAPNISARTAARRITVVAPPEEAP